MEVTISYCAECGFGPLAIRIAESLVERYDQAGLQQVSLVAGSQGIFEVKVDGDVVATRDDHGLPQIEQITEVVGSRLDEPGGQ